MTALLVSRETPFWDRVTKTDSGCWEWAASRHNYGYGWSYWRGRMRLAHRVAWERVNGPIPDGLHVLHHCDNPPCINPDHLWLGTNQDNIQDSVDKNRRRGIKRHSLVRIGPADHAGIVARVKAGEYATDIAREYGVTRQRIQQILAKSGVSTVGTKPRPRRSPILEQMVAMFREGLSVADIADRVGIRKGLVRERLEKRGLDVPLLQPRYETYPHGTHYGYSRGCRCDLCREGHRIYSKGALRERAARLETADVPHGRVSTYRNWHCRCRPCVLANTAKTAARRARLRAEAAK